jgi:hypothetical protein
LFDLAVEDADLLVERGQYAVERGQGGAQGGGDIAPGLLREVGRVGAGQPAAEAFDQAADRVDELGAGFDQLGAGADHGQVLLVLLAAMLDGEQQLRIEAHHAGQGFGIVAVVLRGVRGAAPARGVGHGRLAAGLGQGAGSSSRSECRSRWPRARRARSGLVR